MANPVVEPSILKKTRFRWEHNRVVGQAYVRIFFGVIVAAYVYVGLTNNWFGSPTISLLYASYLFLVASSLFLLVAGFTPSMSWPFIMTGLIFDTSYATYALLEGGISTFFLYGIYIWISIGYGLRFGRKYMLIANLLCIIGFSQVINHADFWKDHVFIGWGMMLWIVLMPFYFGKLLSKLEAAVKEADKANKAKSQFLANMSHEIRTPLTAVIGFSETALDEDQTTEERLFALHTINNSSRHLLNLINNILDFSKIDAGELDIEHVSMNLMQMFSEVESIMMIQAEKKAVDFGIQYHYPIPFGIQGDPIRLKQILLNLCSNAIKFTEHGSVRVDVEYDALMKILNVRVTDTGIGMTADQMQKVFKPFKQADSSTTRNFGGTGLGLSLSKQLAELMDCQLSVQSKPTRGTCFKLEIPCGDISDKDMVCGEIDLPDSHYASKQYPYSSITRKTDTRQETNKEPLLSGDILLVEDNEMNQLLISKYLTKMGARVTVAGNGQEAVEQANGKRFDLIYMDMQMPIMSGIEATSLLREQGYDSPIVALTANATQEDRHTCIEAGCNDFLTKPIVRQTIYAMTAKYLPQTLAAIKETGSNG